MCLPLFDILILFFMIEQVQLQTLTAVVKLYLKKPDSSQGIVQKVLNTATKDCDSPDVRDRAYIYWRLLSMDPAAAKVGFLSVPPYLADIDEPPFSGCRPCSSSTYIHSSDNGPAGPFGRASWGSRHVSQYLSQTCGNLHWKGTDRRRCRAERGRVRIPYSLPSLA